MSGSSTRRTGAAVVVIVLVLLSSLAVLGLPAASAPARSASTVASRAAPLPSSASLPSPAPAIGAAAPISSGSAEWVPLPNLASSPPARYGAVLGSTSAVGYPIVFGGISAPGGTVFSDTDHFTNGTWHLGDLSPSPSPRYNASMAYNTNNRTDLLFGGVSSTGALLSDTWLFTNGTWAQVATTGLTPPARSGAGLAFDPVDNSFLLFGGMGASGALGDTWMFNGAAWSEIAANTAGLFPRTDLGLAYNNASGNFVLFGGVDSHGHLFGDTWDFAPTTDTWSLVPAPNAPSPRFGFSMAYDFVNTSVILFGGEGATGLLNDTWYFENGAWTQVTFAPGLTSPSARLGAAFTYNQASRCMFLFGGFDGAAVNDTWEYCLPLQMFSDSPSATPALIDTNQTTNLTVHVNGGMAPYFANWTGLPAGCASPLTQFHSNLITTFCTPTVPGVFTINVTVSDLIGNTVAPPLPVNLTVLPQPAVNMPTATPSKIYLGGSVTFNATEVPQTGYGFVTWNWTGLPTGCGPAPTNVTSFACTPTANGTFAVHAEATDRLNSTGVSPALYFTVYAIPSSAAPTATPPAIDLGQSVTFKTAGAGGPTGYSFIWLGLPAGCLSANQSEITCTPSAVGNSTITVNVTYYLGPTQTTNVTPALHFTVYRDLAVTVSIQPTSAEVGHTVVVTANVSYGSGGYLYLWTVNGAPYSATGSTFYFTAPSSGTYTFAVKVTDTTNSNKTASATLTAKARPGGGGTSTETWWIVGTVIAVVVALGLVVLIAREMRARKKGRKPGPLAPAGVYPLPPKGGHP